jgi:predicted nucleic acid-binding protein
VSLFYADSSALVKIVSRERESAALLVFFDGADIVTSELALTEIPRAIRRAASGGEETTRTVLARAGELLDTVGLLAIERDTLIAAGAIAEPRLRALDAIHIATAIAASPIDAFVTYDERQGAAARLVGLRTVAPGA